MAKLEGGIFSRPRGKTGGVVFGAARTRTGKVVTSRLLVAPSNPNTPAQQSQRSIFSNSLQIVRGLGAAIYQTDFNRAIAQLPGFQAMMSIFMNNMNDSFLLDPPQETNLGTLHVPDTLSAAAGVDAGQVSVTLSGENGANGAATDEVVILAIGEGTDGVGEARFTDFKDSGQRNDGTINFEPNLGTHPGEVAIIGVYLRSANTPGLLSNVNWFEVTLGT